MNGISSDNGILAQISGQYVSAATDELPDPATVPWNTVRETELDVPGIGRVRFTARQMMSKKGKSVACWWSVVRAVLVA